MAEQKENRAKEVSDLLEKYEVPLEFHELVWEVYRLGAHHFAEIQMERWLKDGVAKNPHVAAKRASGL